MTKQPNPIPLRPQIAVPAHRHFERAAFAQAMAMVRGLDAPSVLRDDEQVSKLIVERATATVGTTTSAGWAAELAQTSFRDFLINLAPYSGASRLIGQAVKAATNRENGSTYPVRSGPVTPAWVAESGAIPVRSGAFTSVQVGPVRKLAHILVWSHEVSKRSDAEVIFRQMLREDIGAGVDAVFFSTAAGSSSAHAGLLYGLSPIAGYGGGDRDALNADLKALALAVAPGGSGNITYVMAPEQAAVLRIIAPDLVAVLDIGTSAALPAGRVIAVDAASLIVDVDPAPDMFASSDASIHMSDVPLELVHDNGSAADPVRSLFQTASTALRVIHELAFAKRRAGAVAYIDGATW